MEDSGLSGSAGKLTDAAQTSANQALGGLTDFLNHVYDIGEEGLGDALKVADAAQNEVSKIFSALTGKITDKIGG